MCWGKFLQPDLNLQGSILDLTPALLQKHGLMALVLDVDETLVPITSAQVSADILLWVEAVQQVAALWLVSNNISETRIKRIADLLKLPYISGAGKPSRRKLRRAVNAMNFPVEQVGMVGDRLFTDVLAGNRLGMFTILVQPMIEPGEAVRQYPVHNFEVWLSQLLGASLTAGKP